MIRYDGPDNKTALQAKFDAQKIAFGPIVFQAAKALCDLGILECVRKYKDNGVTAAVIAEKLELSVYGVKVLLEVGLSSEIVRLVDDKYILTKTGYYLLKDEMTQVNMDFVNDVCYEGMQHLQTAIREQSPAGLATFGAEWETIYAALSSLPPKVQKSWFAFDHFYSDIAFPEVLPIVFRHNPKRIIDVGGNTGKWAIKCVNYNETVVVTIMDLPGQLEKAHANVVGHQAQQRIELHPINILAENCEFPQGADAIWMSQFLDCFSEEQITQILSRAAMAMSQVTTLYILETFWDRQRFAAAAFSLHNTSLYFTCLANGNSKMYHSEEMKGCVENAGLIIVGQTDGIGMGHTLLECKKRQ